MLDQDQLTAVADGSPIKLIVAGPGSGKTTTLAEAVARCCRDNGADRVVCITFTVAGAQELRDRLSKLGVVGVGFIGTLHAYMLRLLRRYHTVFNLPPSLTVIDNQTRDELLQKVLKDLNIKTSVSRVLALSKACDAQLDSSRREHIAVIELNRRLMREGLLTMDSILSLGLKTVKALGNVGCDHLFVDEVQDSAEIDFSIYEAITTKTKLFVGDPDQSIFGFRGACVQGIIRLSLDSRVKTFLLQRNYRCGELIAAAAQRLISNNSDRIRKQTVSCSGFSIINTLPADSQADELAKVDTALSGFVIGKISQNQMAVLCRTNRSVELVKSHLRRCGYQLAEPEKSLPAADGVRSLRLLVSAVANKHSDITWLQLVKAVDGEAAAEAAARAARSSMKSVYSIVSSGQLGAKWKCGDQLLDLTALFPHAVRERLHDACREVSTNGSWDLSDLLVYLNTEERRSPETPGVYVGTVHSAKGREWDAVVVQGLEEGSFPQAKKDTSIEEERRLMFVAMTRARKRLTLTYSKSRPQWRGEGIAPGPVEERAVSRFIEEAGL